MKKLTMVAALAIALSGIVGGCGTSDCERSVDLSIECGLMTDDRDGLVSFCEALGDPNTACIDCAEAAADPCTAQQAGGECEAQCR